MCSHTSYASTPMIPGVNPKQMQKMMQQMGMKQEEIDATHVTIHLANGEEIHFDNPQLSKVDAMGQTTYQLVGEERIVQAETMPEISEEDLETIIEQTGCSLQEAQEALHKTNGDLAEAILLLS